MYSEKLGTYRPGWTNSLTTVSAVPRTIHRIWVGGGMLPPSFTKGTKSMVKWAPEFQRVLWTEKTLSQYFPEVWGRVNDHQIHPAQKADVMRAHILLKFGGVYADTDMELLKPLEGFLVAHQHGAFVYGEEKPGVTSIGFVAARRVSRISSAWAYEAERGLGMSGLPCHTTGPSALKRALVNIYPTFFDATEARYRITNDHEVIALNHTALYPYYLGEPWVPEDHPTAFAVHHWDASWLKNPV